MNYNKINAEEASLTGDKTYSSAVTALYAVVADAKTVLNTIDKISTASSEQATAISQVIEGIDQISCVVQTNSATAEESSAASEELNSRSQLLKTLVERFKLKDRRRSTIHLDAPAGETAKPVSSEIKLLGDKYQIQDPEY